MKLILTVDFGVESLKPRAKRSYRYRYATWHHENLHNAFRMQLRAANTYTTTEIALSAAQFLIFQTPCSFLHVPSPCKGHTAFGPRLRTAGILRPIFTRHETFPRSPPSTQFAPTPRPRYSGVQCAWPRPGIMIIQGSRRSHSSSRRRASSKAAAKPKTNVSGSK